MSRTVTVRLNDEEAKIYFKYSEFNNLPLSTLMKEALMEKIENEIDLKAVLDYEKRLANNEVEFYSLEVAEKMIDYWGSSMEKYYTVVIERNALKQLSKIDNSQRILLLSYIKKNLDGTSNPRATGKPLKGNLKDYWRYRIGNFRIIADIVDQEVRIIIIDIGHRKEIYENY